MNKNIMIVGVGGQGSLLASRILGYAALEKGYDVKVSEVHGMSQRGGSVVTYVKYGDKIHSPIIDKGEADAILSFELLEAARWLPYLRKGGTIITAEQRIKPMPVITGAKVYPDQIIEKIRAKNVTLISADTLSIARQGGNEKASNVALIGLATQALGFDAENIRQAIIACVPAKALKANLAAFEIAYNSAAAL
ncbi:MAG: indolepyruvate oxidoreductase subunit beta [Clostridiales bacterium]|nr:indolepyruvate oxidoreductase subunit beta [Clostridiales bacterium]